MAAPLDFVRDRFGFTRGAGRGRRVPPCVGLSRWRAVTVVLSLALAPVVTAVAGSSGITGTPPADSILVIKSEHRLYLMRDGLPVRGYPIALGLSPVGAKRQEHDFRTPEGRYVIDARRRDSRYFRAKGIVAYGIAPFKVNYYDADTVHGNDERIRARFFSEGVRLMRGIVTGFCARAAAQ